MSVVVLASSCDNKSSSGGTGGDAGSGGSDTSSGSTTSTGGSAGSGGTTGSGGSTGGTAGTGGTTGSAGSGGVDGGTGGAGGGAGGPCEQCLQANCASEYAACSPSCRSLLACFEDCVSCSGCDVEACAGTCAANDSDGIAGFLVVGGCVQETACKPLCPPSRVMSDCMDCMATHCAAETNACFLTKDCSEYFSCLGHCTPGDTAAECNAFCEATYSDGGAGVNAPLFSCTQTACASTCFSP